MARPREFDSQEALNRATHLFWQKGYEETSMADLVEATGVSRYGFYTEFGDKQDLFIKCLSHYANTAINTTLSPLEKADASLAEIHAYFNQLSSAVQNSQPPMGCLIGNTAMSTTALETSVTTLIDHHYTRMHAAFLNALQHALSQGELAPDTTIEAVADYLVGIANGYLGCLRSGMTPESIQRFIEVALKVLE